MPLIVDGKILEDGRQQLPVATLFTDNYMSEEVEPTLKVAVFFALEY